MFAIRFLILSIIGLHRHHLTSANIAIISSASSAGSNLTCEEFCEMSVRTSANRDESVTHHHHHHPAGSDDQQPPWTQSATEFRGLINEEYLARSSIVFGLTVSAQEDYLSSTCFRHLKKIEQASLRREVWAMKVLDSSGGKEAGFLWGHNYWLGSRDGCLSLQSPVYITLSDQYERAMKKGLINDLAPFEMDYRVIYLKHHSPWQVEIKFMTERIIHVGLCLPRSCSTSEIHNMTQHFLDGRTLQEGNIYDIHPEVIRVKDLKLSETFVDRRSLKIVGCILIFTILMLVIASCTEDTGCKRMKSTLNWTNIKDNVQDTLINNRNDPLVWYPHPYENSFLQKFVKCFDLVDNCKSLFSVSESVNAIPVINGLRSVSCVWIVFFHVIWYMYFTVENKTFLLSYGERVFFQYVSTAPLLVDVFFTISGFLLAYNFTRNESKVKQIRESSLSQNLRAFGKMIFHRYLRLAPLYLVLTGIVEIVTAYIENISVFHIHERYDQTCSKYWWRNILFIQNFFHQEELCLNWTWSLACEMQFYILFTGLLFLYVRYPREVKNIFFTGLLSSIIWTCIIGCRSKYQLSFDVVYNTGTDIYINPFVRILPYFIGVGGGWILATYKGQLNIHPAVEKFIWNLAIVVFFACIYSTVKRDMSVMATLTLLVVGRLSFATSVCWMIIGSAKGHGVWWSRFLEWKVFQHINKLSYAIYLLNPIVIAVVFSLSNTSTHADPILLAVLTSGFVVIVYICSIIFSLSFEIPYCNLSSQLLKPKFKTS